MLLRVAVFLGLLAVFCETSRADKDNFKLQGRLGLGIEGTSPEDQNKIFEMRVGVQSRRRDRIKANIELRADEGSRNVTINDAFVDYKNEAKTLRVRAGRGKKIMGWEWLYPTSSRLTIHRSGSSGYLEDRGFVGRDYFAEVLALGPLEPEDEKAQVHASTDAMDSAFLDPFDMIPADESWRAGISFHYDESGTSGFIASWVPRLNDHLRLGSWLQVQRSVTPSAPIMSVGGMISPMWRLAQHRMALEWWAGIDPFRSEVERDFLTGHTVWASSLRAEYGYLLERWNPYVSMSYVRRDLRTSDDWLLQPIAGVRYFILDRLDFAFEYRYSNSDSGTSHFTAPDHYSALGLMGRYYF